MTDSDPSEYPTVKISDMDTHAEFVIANPELTEGTYIPIEALQELIKEWQTKPEFDYPTEPRECADEIQAVIDEYE